MLTVAELNSMRMTQALVLPEVATIGRRSYSSDGAGGAVETVTETVAPCRVAVSTREADRAIVAGRQLEAPPVRITFAQGTDVRSDDKLEVGGRLFEVLAVYAPASYETARVCVCVTK